MQRLAMSVVFSSVLMIFLIMRYVEVKWCGVTGTKIVSWEKQGRGGGGRDKVEGGGGE